MNATPVAIGAIAITDRRAFPSRALIDQNFQLAGWHRTRRWSPTSWPAPADSYPSPRQTDVRAAPRIVTCTHDLWDWQHPIRSAVSRKFRAALGGAVETGPTPTTT